MGDLIEQFWFQISPIHSTSDEEEQSAPRVHFTLSVRVKWTLHSLL
jgi:hypothetical protein